MHIVPVGTSILQTSLPRKDGSNWSPRQTARADTASRVRESREKVTLEAATLQWTMVRMRRETQDGLRQRLRREGRFKVASGYRQAQGKTPGAIDRPRRRSNQRGARRCRERVDAGSAMSGQFVALMGGLGNRLRRHRAQRRFILKSTGDDKPTRTLTSPIAWMIEFCDGQR